MTAVPRLALTAGLLLATLAVARAAGPALRIDTACATTAVGTASDVSVPVAIELGTGDGGQPNAVAAIDLTVEYGADDFEVVDVVLPSRLDAAQWSVQWPRPLGLPETPGKLAISLVPQFLATLPALTDGAIVELKLKTKNTGQSHCAAITIATDTLVISTPPLGLKIAPGPVTGGGVSITELCQNCIDDDGDGLTDLADPDCEHGALTFPKKAIKNVFRKKGPKIDATIGAALTIADKVQVQVQPEVAGAGCQVLEGNETKRKQTKKATKVSFDVQGGSLTLQAKKKPQLTRIVADRLPIAAVPDNVDAVSVSLWNGKDAFYARLVRQKRSRRR